MSRRKHLTNIFLYFLFVVMLVVYLLVSLGKIV